MSKVLLINGSPHEQGNTYVALSEAAKTLNEHGIETEIVWIGNKPVRGCIACGACEARGDGHCAFNDDLCNAVIDKMNDADALIVGSPVYYGTPTGNVLNLIHRMLYAGAQVAGKPAAAAAVCRRGGATAAFQTLQMPFQMVNMPLVTSQYWNIVYGLMPGEASQDAEGLQTMRTMARNMAWMIKQFQSGTAMMPEMEPWQGTHFIR
jgi:multimeric flavodoxin WrbA